MMQKKLQLFSLRKQLVLYSFVLFIIACGQPVGILSQGEMIEIITELHKMDGTLSTTTEGQQLMSQRDTFYNALLEQHHATRAEFDSSLAYYTRQPKKFEKIYDEVISNLTELKKNVEEGKIKSLNTPEKPTKKEKSTH